MRLYSMDPVLIDIYNIRNLESVKVWDLVMNSTSKTLVIPAILVVYDGGKHMNLCAKDKYFDVFVKKVLEVYRDEKNNILEDSLTDPFKLHSKIVSDSHSEAILDKESVYDINEIFKFYRDKCAYNGSLLFQNDEVRPLIPMIKYHLEEFFKNTDRVVSVNLGFSGYRDSYVLSGKVDGIDTDFPFIYESVSDREYKFRVGGVYKDASSTDLTIKFKDDGIDVLTSIGDSLVSSTNYKIVDGAVKVINDIERDGITIKYFNGDIPLACDGTFSNLKDIDHEDNLTWYRLPWGALYGVNVNIDDLSDTEKVIEISNKFIDGDDSSFISVEHYSMNYKRNKSVNVEADSVVLDSMSKNMLGRCVDYDSGLFVIETGFDELTTDYYSNSKYFYHGVLSDNGVEGIKKENLISLGHDEDILSGSDLSNKYKMKKLVKGE